MLEAFISLIFFAFDRVILFRNNREEVFKKFLKDIIPNLEITTLPKESYEDLAEIKKKSGLDFDDAYQFQVAKDRDLKIVTMDKDFKKNRKKADILYIV